MVGSAARRMLTRYAARYETAAFLEGDPSWFMHQVKGDANREATAFVAAALSFGSREQFMPKIQSLVECAGGDVDGLVRDGRFARIVACGSGECFYRFFTHARMHDFLRAYQALLVEHGTLGEYVRRECGGDGFLAVDAVCRWFATHDGGGVVPKDAKSACKRVCMFLRWMVRSGSPVDLGLWSGFIDRRTLVMPLDTHVVQQANRLGLLSGGASSMAAAKRLTAALAEVFPEDPLRGDFALFGYGVNHKASLR